MSAAPKSDYHDLLKIVSTWPVEERISFAHDVLGTLQSRGGQSGRRRNTFSRALGLARVNGTPPDNAEVARILDQRRTEKYGR